jgi:BirA family biotin operon repressor/biotin-[acetyl-CoA-carboxylase] ligase
MSAFEEWTLPGHRIGRRVVVYDYTDSTSNRAADLGHDPANDGLVVLAREQTAGRGQQGRSWQSPAGSGVLMSVLLFPPAELRRPAILTAWAAVSVCDTIRQAANLQAKIKWPNDVLLHGKKICGILIEQRTTHHSPLTTHHSPLTTHHSPLTTHHSPLTTQHSPTVVGIGLNVNQSDRDFLGAGLEQATSLLLATNQRHDWEAMARRLIGLLDEEYARLQSGDLAGLESSWKWRLGLLGKRVVAECVDGAVMGRLQDIGWDGLQVASSDGRVLRIEPERVKHLELIRIIHPETHE